MAHNVHDIYQTTKVSLMLPQIQLIIIDWENACCYRLNDHKRQNKKDKAYTTNRIPYTKLLPSLISLSATFFNCAVLSGMVFSSSDDRT